MYSSAAHRLSTCDHNVLAVGDLGSMKLVHLLPCNLKSWALGSSFLSISRFVFLPAIVLCFYCLLAGASTNQQGVATYWISSKSILSYVRKWTLKFLNEGQSHLNWYQNVQPSGFYYDAKFRRNWSVWIQTTVNGFVFFLTKLHK